MVMGLRLLGVGLPAGIESTSEPCDDPAVDQPLTAHRRKHAAMPASYLLVFVPALVGAALAAIAYFAPIGITGVEGTAGALLALVGAGAVTLGALLAMAPGLRGWPRGLLDVLLFVGAALTSLAAWFLMQVPFAIAMALAALGLLAAIVLRPRRRIA